MRRRSSNRPRVNLTGEARDLWLTGTRTIRDQGETLRAFSRTVAEAHSELASAAVAASDASDRLADWLESQAGRQDERLRGPARENYTWNLRNVHLLPYTWESRW